jgi:DNA-binding LacI/PurR family transcriptional regulator
VTVTIYDVAERAGVSISTVSKSLNVPARVRPATRQRVMAAIDELGFVPRSEALARARKGVGRVGIVAPLTTYPSFEIRLRGVLDALHDESFELVVYDQASLTVRRDYLASLPLSDRLDGVIVMSLQFDDTVAERLLNRELPTVLVEFARRGFSSVRVDDVAGGRLAAEHLVSLGHRRCAFVGESTMSTEIDIEAAHRVDGFRGGLEAAGIDLPHGYVSLGAYGMDEACRQAHGLLDLAEPPTAILAHSDVQAVGVLKAVKQRRLRCPEDVAVVGFDDLDFAAYVGLTTIAQPLRDSGRIAADLLLARIADPAASIQDIFLPLRLVRRDTT